MRLALVGWNWAPTVEGREPILIRAVAREFRDEPTAIAAIQVQTPLVTNIPLGQLANITIEQGRI